MRIILNTERCIFSITTLILMNRCIKQSLLMRRRRLGSCGKCSINSLPKFFLHLQRHCTAEQAFIEGIPHHLVRCS